MRLGFDLDEVVVNLTAEFEKHLELNYGIEWPLDCFVHYDFVKCRFHEDEELDLRITKEMILLANDADFQFQAEPVEGAQRALQKLKKTGHKIYLITSRPVQNQPLTFKWLRQHDIPFDGLRVIGHSEEKGRHGMQLRLDMFVDDLEKNLESMLVYKKRWRKGLLLFDRPWNNASYIDESRFTRVNNWKEILRHVGVSNR